MDDDKIIMDSDNLFIRFCFYTALWAQIFSRYRCIRSFSSNLVYTGALQRDVHLASLRVQDSVFVFSKDSLHRLDMSRLEHVCVEEKWPLGLYFFCFMQTFFVFIFSKTKLQTIPFTIDIANVVLNVLSYILLPFLLF